MSVDVYCASSHHRRDLEHVARLGRLVGKGFEERLLVLHPREIGIGEFAASHVGERVLAVEHLIAGRDPPRAQTGTVTRSTIDVDPDAAHGVDHVLESDPVHCHVVVDRYVEQIGHRLDHKRRSSVEERAV